MGAPRKNPNTDLIKEISDKQIKLATEWSIMKNQWTEMKAKFDQNEKKLDKILSYIQNDDSTGSEGMFQQVRKNTVFRQDIKAKVTILGIVGGALSGVLFWILGLIFKH